MSDTYCQNCKFREQHSIKTCTRFPPQPVPSFDSQRNIEIVWRHPVVGDYDYCAEFKEL